jgi:hypothetical protein
MNRLGLQGVRRGKVGRTTISDMKPPCPLAQVNRQFKAERPNQLWVPDFTHVSTWRGWLYVDFVIDVYLQLRSASFALAMRISWMPLAKDPAHFGYGVGRFLATTPTDTTGKTKRACTISDASP